MGEARIRAWLCGCLLQSRRSIPHGQACSAMPELPDLTVVAEELQAGRPGVSCSRRRRRHRSWCGPPRPSWRSWWAPPCEPRRGVASSCCSPSAAMAVELRCWPPTRCWPVASGSSTAARKGPRPHGAAAALRRWRRAALRRPRDARQALPRPPRCPRRRSPAGPRWGPMPMTPSSRWRRSVSGSAGTRGS